MLSALYLSILGSQQPLIGNTAAVPLEPTLTPREVRDQEITGFARAFFDFFSRPPETATRLFFGGGNGFNRNPGRNLIERLFPELLRRPF
jgi:hypothetical protein